MGQGKKKRKTSFIVHEQFYEPIKTFSDEQMGKLFRALFEYQINDIEEVSSDISMAFLFFKNQLDLDNKKYEEVCEKRATSGSKGGKQKVANLANASKCKQKVANLADNDNEYDNDNENEYEISQSIEITEEDMKSYKLDDRINPSLKELKMCSRVLVEKKDMNPEFVNILDEWLDYKIGTIKGKYPSNKAFSVFVSTLRDDSSGYPSVARRMVQKAISCGWKSVPALDYEEKKKYMPYNMYQ